MRIRLLLLASTVALAAALPAPGHAAAARPDLVPRAVLASAGVLEAGRPARFSTLIRNRGQRGTPRSSTVRFWLSKDLRKNSGDRLLGGAKTLRIGAGRSRAVVLRVTVAVTVPAGTWRVLACADAKRKIRESSERNNCLAGKLILITVPATSPDDPGTQTPGDGGGGGGTGPDLTFSGSSSSWSPNSAAIASGATVRWSGSGHTVQETVSLGGADKTDGFTPTTKSLPFDFQFVTPGTYYFRCTIHGGMNGQLTIT